MNLTKELSIYFNIFTFKYSKEQCQQILLGKKRNLDISIYSNPKFNKYQMFEIRTGLEEGLDASWYAKPEFNIYQIFQIKWAYKEILMSRFMLTINLLMNKCLKFVQG